MKGVGKFLMFLLYSALLFLTGVLWTAKKASPIIIRKQKDVEKFRKLFSVMDVWVRKKQQSKSMKAFLKRNNYRSVAIYGFSNIGRLLEEELKEHMEIHYGIDRREIFAGFPVYKPEDPLPKVDVVIVTAAYEFEEIEGMLKKKLGCPIYSIEDIVYFMD